jgi:DNA (cytosine-5)-methyltransferase 1
MTIAGNTYVSEVATNRLTGDGRGDWWRAFLDGQRPVAGVARGRVRSLDLFCGPGGLALGFGQAARELGYELISEAAVDADAAATKVYRTNHETRVVAAKSVSSLIDFQVRGVSDQSRFRYQPEVIDETFAQLAGSVDVVLAGPPCQGHSNLNNHTRRSDRRNELYLTVPAFAIALNASMVVIENVPAVVHDRQQVVSTTTRLLRDAGYEVTAGRFMADRMGWPQTRQRFFLLARKLHTPLDPKLVQGMLEEPKPRSLWWALEDLEDAPVDGLMTLAVDWSEENQRRIQWLFENDAHDLPPSERPECHQEGTTYNAVYGRLYKDRPAPTITSGFMTPGRGRFIHPTRLRTLTPREAARLQGFPDTYRFHPDERNPSSKMQLAKWIGDAVPMPLGHAAGVAVLGCAPLERSTY